MNFTVPGHVAIYYYWSAFAIWNNQGQLKAQGGFYEFMPYGYAGNWRSTVYASYPAATGTYPYLDSALVTITGGTVYPEYPWFRVMLPARIRSSATYIAGSEVVAANYEKSWTAVVSEEPTSYRYRWYVDGSLVSASQTLHVSLSEGSHVIRLEAKLSDDSVETIERTVVAIDCGGPNDC